MTREAPALRTARLVLRPWQDSDLEPFATLSADPRVMEHYQRTHTREQCTAHIANAQDHFAAYGFGLWAVALAGDGAFIGYTGIQKVGYEAHFTPSVEIGWRLAFEHWGHGYATEAARAALAFGFETVGLSEIVSMTVAANRRSYRVMQKLGMHRDPSEDFDHPLIPDGHPLQRHMLYRLRRDEFR